jgi:hypothetical protein
MVSAPTTAAIPIAAKRVNAVSFKALTSKKPDFVQPAG